ncbi:DUF2441 domain-containing protein [Loktanella sp. TSTF-M6]|uniref:DUF2441 domain-containing protein n=1 Tax=Loktanella gaetbuli TaxID=2881335 RepID=A0ABS8BTG0_9RHOB|nr:DUF2441 domain-containing protein [Loktanella gaetbuli]
MYQPNSGSYAVAFRERVLEDVRAVEFPDKPSRLSACFVLPSLSDALKYRDHPERRASLIYEVEFISEPPVIHFGDWTMSLPEGDSAYFDGMSKFAQEYWSGKSIGRPEILAPVPIRILRCMDDGFLNLPGLEADIES